jgi:multiple RNA-binding domain-containing protein 1
MEAGEEDGEGEGDDAQQRRSAAGSSYKQQKEREQKASAGNRVAWNSLFMRPDTVAEAVAAQFGEAAYRISLTDCD